jgi:IS5 family transposase
MTAAIGVILDLTEQIQAAIDGGDWQRASEIDTDRRAQLERLVADHAASDTTGALRAALENLERGNRRFMGEVQHHQRAILRDASMVRTGQAAVASYGGTPAEL